MFPKLLRPMCKKMFAMLLSTSLIMTCTIRNISCLTKYSHGTNGPNIICFGFFIQYP